MNLDEGQRAKVSQWISEGLKLSEIQNRLAAELGVTMTYMEVRLLVDDLKLRIVDPEPPKTADSAATGKVVPEKDPAANNLGTAKAGQPGVALTVDQLARPGALVSGKVTFSDGNTADWYMDQTGRLGLMPQKTGYRPPASDVQDFQAALEKELSKLGF